MTWYKVHKLYRGGRYPSKGYDYFEVPNYTKKDLVQNEAEWWADNTNGGYNYGWTVYWSRVKAPSKKWIENKIIELKQKIKIKQSTIKIYKEEIKRYKEELNG